MKKALIICLFVIMMLAPTVVGANEQMPIIMYHNITDDAALVLKDETVHITRDTFEEHMSVINMAGYNPISLDDYYEYRKTGKALPEKPIIITFDDGYISNYTIAYPILKRYNYKAAIFVIASRMGADNIEFPHFSWENAREMEKSGMIQIESHSFTHPDFSSLTYPQTVVEMRLAKFAIESNMGKKCKYFAYPYGKTNPASAKVAQAAGYEAVFVGKDINANTQNEDMFALPRYTVRGSWSGEKLLELIKS